MSSLRFKSLLRIAVLAFAILVPLAGLFAQTPQPPAAQASSSASPEVAALIEAHQGTLSRIQSARDAKLVKINALYAAELNRLLDEFTKAGNLEVALAIKTERDQTLAGKAPTTDQRKAMPSAAFRPRQLRQEYQTHQRGGGAVAHR